MACQSEKSDEMRRYLGLGRNKIKYYLDSVLFRGDEIEALKITETKLINCLEILLRGPDHWDWDRKSVLSENGWACTLLLIARKPVDDACRAKMLCVVEPLVKLWKAAQRAEDGQQSRAQRVYRTGIVNVLAVIAYFGEEACEHLRQAGALDVFFEALNSKDDQAARTMGAIGVALLVKGNDLFARCPDNFFQGLKNILDASLESKSYNNFQFDPADIMNCIFHLSQSETAAERLLSCGIIETLTTALKVNADMLKFIWLERNKDLLKSLALEVLLNLSRIHSGIDRLSTNSDLLRKISGFVTNPVSTEATVRPVSETLANVARHRQRMLPNRDPVPAGGPWFSHQLPELAPKAVMRVMISHSWRAGPFFEKIAAELKRHNIAITNENQDDPSFSSMVESVCSADLAIVCLCPDYGKSAAARAEAELLLKVGVPIIPVVCSQSFDNSFSWLKNMLYRVGQPTCSIRDGHGESDLLAISEIVLERMVLRPSDRTS